MERRPVFGGRCSILAPTPITNSGVSDGGWMDTEGVKAAGLTSIFNGPWPVDCFYSNRAYQAPGFCTIMLQLVPQDEENLKEKLDQYCWETENDMFRNDSRRQDKPLPPIADPNDIGSAASAIAHRRFVCPVTPDPHGNLPLDLVSDTTVAILRFEGRGDVFLKACNFHTETIDYLDILGSIQYNGVPMTFPPWPAEPTLASRLLNAMVSSSSISVDPSERCDQCQVALTNRTNRGKCSRCQRAQYCSRKCQKAHWKTHKPLCASEENDS